MKLFSRLLNALMLILDYLALFLLLRWYQYSKRKEQRDKKYFKIKQRFINYMEGARPLDKNNIKTLYRKSKPLIYIESSSGGSTGVPTTVKQSLFYWIINRAQKKLIYFKSSGSIYPRVLKLWGEDSNKRSFKQKIRLFLTRTIQIDTFRMNSEKYQDIIKLIDKTKPDIIEGYASSLYELTRNISKYPSHNPSAIISSAGVLSPQLMTTLRKYFPKSAIVNRYGSREVGDIAWGISPPTSFELPILNINDFSHRVEILRDDGEIVDEGTGSILVTCLTNSAMPIYRYNLGDRVTISQVGHIQEVIGRTVDVFKGLSGELVDGEYFTHLLYGRDEVSSFQIIQKSEGIFINIHCEDSRVQEQVKTDFRNQVSKILPGLSLFFEFNKPFEKDPSGKIRFTRCDI